MPRSCWRTLPLSATEAERGQERSSTAVPIEIAIRCASHSTSPACSSCTTHACRDELSRNTSGSCGVQPSVQRLVAPESRHKSSFPALFRPAGSSDLDAPRLLGSVFITRLDSGAVDQPTEPGVVDVIDDFAGHDHVDGLIDNAAVHYEPLSGIIVQAVLVNLGGVKPDLGEHAVK